MGKKSLTHKEKVRVAAVLKYYDITYYQIKKVRSVYKVIGVEQNYCLKKLKHGKKKSQMGAAIVNHLHKKGFFMVPMYIPTISGELYVEFDQYSYYMTEWIEGKEADFKKQDVFMQAVRVLALFHKASMGFEDPENAMITDHFLKGKQEYYNGRNQLAEYKKMIGEQKKGWTKEYRKYIHCFLEYADLALYLFDLYHYDAFIEKNKRTKGFCHESFYYQNVIVDKRHNYYIIDLDSCARNIYMYDLGKLLRRMMWAKEYKWDFQVIKMCIEAYKEIRPIEKGESGILLGILIFPHKYIKLGKQWIEKKEKWSKKKYDKKIDKQIQYISHINKFITDYSEYYGMNIKSDIRCMI